MTDLSWRTATLDLEEKHFDHIENAIQQKDIEEYLISHEQITRDHKEKPHFHILVYTTPLNFTNLIKNFVTKFQLSNKSGKHGGKRRYTTLQKSIPSEELEHFMTYLCKDKNVRSTLDEDVLKKLIDKSFKKEANSHLVHRIYAYLDEYHKEPTFPRETKPKQEGNITFYSGKDYSRTVYDHLKKLIIIFHIET